jgi:hypothetical protein
LTFDYPQEEFDSTLFAVDEKRQFNACALFASSTPPLTSNSGIFLPLKAPAAFLPAWRWGSFAAPVFASSAGRAADALERRRWIRMVKRADLAGVLSPSDDLSS